MKQKRHAINLFFALVVLGLPSFAMAHVENCAFTALVTKVTKQDTKTVIADVEVKQAESEKGVLSYLDCKQWIGVSTKEVKIMLKNPSKLAPGQTVQLHFMRFNGKPGSETVWELQ